MATFFSEKEKKIINIDQRRLVMERKIFIPLTTDLPGGCNSKEPARLRASPVRTRKIAKCCSFIATIRLDSNNFNKVRCKFIRKTLLIGATILSRTTQGIWWAVVLSSRVQDNKQKIPGSFPPRPNLWWYLAFNTVLLRCIYTGAISRAISH